MRFWLVPSVIRIEIPALDRLIDYLTQQSTLQETVDGLTRKVATSDAPLAEALEQKE